MDAGLSTLTQGPLKQRTANVANNYENLWENDANDKSKVEERKKNYPDLVNAYYDLATDFYEYGWGTSFHFAPSFQGESTQASIARHEHYLALKLSLRPGMKVLDVGCGVGGPLMEIARFSGATITGLNNNEYQVSRARKYVQKYGLQDVGNFTKGDFMKMPFENNTYDSIYAIEATCHAPTKEGIYGEIFRVLKPGSLFGAYEWCMTDKYDPNNEVHRDFKRDIEIGDGLPDIDTTMTVLEALKNVGFEIIEYSDMAITNAHFPVPWYAPFLPGFTFSGFKVSALGRFCSHYFVTALEYMRVLPQGAVKTHTVLLRAHRGLVGGGQLQIFTPMFFFLVRKPESRH